MSGQDTKEKNTHLTVILFVLIAIIICLVIIIAIVFIFNTKEQAVSVNDTVSEIIQEDLSDDERYSLPGVTKANMFTNKIKERLSREADYNVPDAISDYQKAFNESNGDARFYIAMEFADFLIEYHNDYSKAISVLTDVESQANDNTRYYDLFANLYEIVGDEAKSEYYKNISNEIKASDQGTAIEGFE